MVPEKVAYKCTGLGVVGYYLEPLVVTDYIKNELKPGIVVFSITNKELHTNKEKEVCH